VARHDHLHLRWMASATVLLPRQAAMNLRRRFGEYAAGRRSYVQEHWRSTVENADHDDAVRD
jgi:hypothetical protein